jgi:hypothetical protein
MQELCFEACSSQSILKGHPRYVDDDYAFDFKVDPKVKAAVIGPSGSTSLVIGTLQLEVAIDTMQCLYIWGYCPTQRWEMGLLLPPASHPSALKVCSAIRFARGVSVGLEVVAKPYFDSRSGWFCIGNKEPAANGLVIEFATNTVAVIVERQLISLWIKPENWNNLAMKMPDSYPNV